MTKLISSLPADNEGNKLFLTRLRKEDKKLFVFYKSTYNDIPFRETELHHDTMGSYTINSDNGTVLFRIPAKHVAWLMEPEK